MPKATSKYKKHLKVAPIPVPPGCEHPPAPNEVLMRHEFTVGLIAPKGAGKTTMIINWLMYYAGYFHDIFIFSPSIDNDEKWDYVKKQKLLAENKELKAWIRSEEAKRKTRSNGKDIVERPPVASTVLGELDTHDDDEFDPVIPEKNYFTSYNEDTLRGILDQQDQVILALAKHGKKKYLADRILLIFDDLVGSNLFSQAQDNYFKIFNTRHRHFSASVMMVTQSYKEIPKTIRTNYTGLIAFAIANDKEVEVIYEEHTMGIKRDPWLKMFEHCTSDEYGFMYLNSQRDRGFRCMKNFDAYINFKPEDAESTEKNLNNINNH